MKFKVGDRVRVIGNGKNYRDGEIRTVTGEFTLINEVTAGTGHFFLDNCDTATNGIVLYDGFRPYRYIKKHEI